MDKKTLKYIGVVLVLILIIVIKKNINRFSSDLPELTAWEDSIKELTISKNNTTIRVYKKSEKWVIGDNAYPADQKGIENFIKGMKDLKITDLISNKKFYNRFELNPEKAIQIKVSGEKTLLRNILIGKTSAGGRQAYVKLADAAAVYLASGNLNSDFNKSVDDLRDKKIMEVTASAIESLALKYNNQSYTLVKEKITAKPADDKKEENKPKEIWVVQNNKGLKLDQKKISSLVNGLGNVSADAYPDEKIKPNQKSLCALKIYAFNKELTLDIFKKLKNDKYLCKSSESDYIFTLSKSKAEGFMKTLKDLK